MVSIYVSNVKHCYQDWTDIITHIKTLHACKRFSWRHMTINRREETSMIIIQKEEIPLKTDSYLKHQ